MGSGHWVKSWGPQGAGELGDTADAQSNPNPLKNSRKEHVHKQECHRDEQGSGKCWQNDTRTHLTPNANRGNRRCSECPEGFEACTLEGICHAAMLTRQRRVPRSVQILKPVSAGHQPPYVCIGRNGDTERQIWKCLVEINASLVLLTGRRKADC